MASGVGLADHLKRVSSIAPANATRPTMNAIRPGSASAKVGMSLMGTVLALTAKNRTR